MASEGGREEKLNWWGCCWEGGCWEGGCFWRRIDDEDTPELMDLEGMQDDRMRDAGDVDVNDDCRSSRISSMVVYITSRCECECNRNSICIEFVIRI